MDLNCAIAWVVFGTSEWFLGSPTPVVTNYFIKSLENEDQRVVN